MRALKILLSIVGFCTLTNADWCNGMKCPDTVEVHCADSSYSKCTYKGLNYCLVKVQECYRKDNGYPKFNAIVKGKCLYDRPPCPEFKPERSPTKG